MRYPVTPPAATLLVLICSVVGCSKPETQKPTSDTPQVVADAIVQEPMATVAAPTDQILNGATPAEGILAGGQPTREQLTAIADNGYRSVINLRTEGERGNTDPSVVESLGMVYVEIPIEGADGLTEENARRLATALEEVEMPAVVHCGSGNRVGALFAMKAYYVDGLPAEEALMVGQQAGMTRLEPAVRQKLGLPPS
jgi:uncharacterized protein (TIGR01244 family)